jgi:hypothetical protein
MSRCPSTCLSASSPPAGSGRTLSRLDASVEYTGAHRGYRYAGETRSASGRSRSGPITSSSRLGGQACGMYSNESGER